ncbi:MAG: hypothetical protein M5R42_18760 [Rhodocyclaceae bacterium]|nr:hypothetical protein [Rhodocyclaceae bacterium]
MPRRRARSSEVELNFRNEAGKELAETQGRLNALSEGNVGLADKVKHSDIRSPVRGTVKRLLVNTVGGVVQPGQGCHRDRATGGQPAARGQGAAQGHRFPCGRGRRPSSSSTAYDFFDLRLAWTIS